MKKCVIVVVLILISCSHQKSEQEPELVRIQTVDQNGTCETISSLQRLKRYKEVDFLSSQPFQKVVRFFKDKKQERNQTILTSYHANGQIKQYLQARDLQAFGTYQEWHSNGHLKIEAKVVGGKADLDISSQKSWLFDGLTKAYDEKGRLLAEISYQKGVLDRTSTYYYPDGTVQKEIPYVNGEVQGYLLEFYPEQTLKRKTFYQNNLPHETSLTYWEEEVPLAIEEYKKGKLVLGQYFDRTSKPISGVQNGEGTRFILLENGHYQLIEYKHGIVDGQIQTFNENSQLMGVYSLKNGKKHGRETQFYINPMGICENVLKYTIDWMEDQIHGSVKTWYENGYMESQKQFSKNKKNGSSICWYKDGSLMMVEEYENDLLVEGKYYKKQEKDPISTVEKGNGQVTLYDADGVFVQKIVYQDCKPKL